MNLNFNIFMFLLCVKTVWMDNYDFLPKYAIVNILADNSTQESKLMIISIDEIDRFNSIFYIAYPSSCKELDELFRISTGYYYITKDGQDSVVFCIRDTNKGKFSNKNSFFNLFRNNLIVFFIQRLIMVLLTIGQLKMIVKMW